MPRPSTWATATTCSSIARAARWIGYVTGNAGSDTFELGGAGSFDLGLLGNGTQYRDFETLLVGAGSSFTAAGTSSFAGDVALNGSLVLNGSLSSAAGQSSAMERCWAAMRPSAPSRSERAARLRRATRSAQSRWTVRRHSTRARPMLSRSTQNSSDQIVAGTSAINGGTVVLSALGPLTSRQGLHYSLSVADHDARRAIRLARRSRLPVHKRPDTWRMTAVPSRWSWNPTASPSPASPGPPTRRRSPRLSMRRAAARPIPRWPPQLPGEEDAVATAYDLLSGEVHASLGNTLYNQSTLVADTLVGRLRQASAATSPASAALAFDGPVLAYGPDVANRLVSDGDASSRADAADLHCLGSGLRPMEQCRRQRRCSQAR